MRMKAILCLLLALAACAGPQQAPDSPLTAAGAPQAQTTEAPRPTATTQAMATVAAAPAAALPPMALLQRWNQDERRYEIAAVDLATGQDIPGRTPIVVSRSSQFLPPHALSAAGTRFVGVESHGRRCEGYAGGTSCWPTADVLHLVEVTSWREVTATLPAGGWTSPLVFSPGGSRLAVAHNADEGSTLMLFQTETGALLGQQTLPFPPSFIGFAEEQGIIVYGVPPGEKPGISKPGAPRVSLLDATTLAVRWEQRLPGIVSGFYCLEGCDQPHGELLSAYWSPAVVLARDRRRLYVIHADEEKLTTVDLEAQQVQTMAIRRPQSLVERLLALTAGVAEAKGGMSGTVKSAVLSADGRHLYVVGRTMDSTRDADGNWQFAEVWLDLQVVDVATGRLLQSKEAQADRIRLTPDGEHLLLDGWDGQSQEGALLEAATLEPAGHVSSFTVTIQPVAGETVFLAMQDGESTQLAVLDPATLAVVHSWSVDSFATWLSPNR